MRLVTVDLDGSLVRGPARGLPADAVVDLAEAGPSLRIVATRGGIGRFIEAMGPATGRPEAVFYGSGDFHHLTAALIGRVGQRLSVIHFDNHPDWVSWPRSFNCGGWVCRALAMDHVARVITIGPSSTDLVRPELKFADLAALREGRLELYPWRHPPSFVMGRYGNGPDRRQQGHRIAWRQLADENWQAFLDELASRLPQTPLYITIDKDCLGRDEAVTNWDQGGMSLSHLLAALETLARVRPVIGIDVCGDYAAPRFRDPFRAALALLDHPRGIAPGEQALAINHRTNLVLAEQFRRILN